MKATPAATRSKRTSQSRLAIFFVATVSPEVHVVESDL